MAPGIDLRHPREGLAIPHGLQGPRVGFYDAYLVFMSFAVIGSMLAAWVTKVLGPALTHAVLGADRTLTSAFFLSWALILIGGSLLIIRVVGPIGFTRPVLVWCLDEPGLSRQLHARCLRSRMLAATSAVGLAGALGVLLLWPMLGWRTALFAVAGLALAGGAAVVIGTSEQGRTGTGGRGGVSSRFAMFLCAAGLLTWYSAGYGSVAAGLRSALVIVTLVVAVLIAWAVSQMAGVQNMLRSGAIPVGELHRAGDIIDRVEMTAVTLSTAAWAGRPVPRRSPRIGTLPGALVRRMRGTAWAVAAADASRLSIRWQRALILIALIPMPGSFTRLAGDHWASLAVLALVYMAATSLAQWFFAWEASTSLKFLLPFNDLSTRLALLATPLSAALVMATTAVWCARLPAWWIGTAWTCAVIGIFRRLAAERARTDVGLLVATPMGALPLGLFQRLAAGWDVILLAGVSGFYVAGSVVFQFVVTAGVLYAALQMTKHRRGRKQG